MKNKSKQDKRVGGSISVKVIDHDRLKAIFELARAVRLTAEALSVPAQVTIEGCTISHVDTGIEIKTTPEVKQFIWKTERVNVE